MAASRALGDVAHLIFERSARENVTVPSIMLFKTKYSVVSEALTTNAIDFTQP